MLDQSIFKANYYNGKSSHKLNATIKLTSRALEVHYETPDGFHLIDKWAYNEIVERERISKEQTNLHLKKEDRISLLEVFGENLKKQLKFYDPSAAESWHTKLMSSSWSILLGVCLLLFAVLAALYFWLVPMAAEKLAESLPFEVEKKIGEKMANSMLEQYEQDTIKTEKVRALASKWNFGTEYPIEIYVVKSDIVNAFATPGGKVIIFDGLLNKMDNYDELAGLLGHEIAHVKKRHVLKGIFRDLSGYIIISAIFGDINGIGSMVMEHASTLTKLSYTRGLEEEADMEGLSILYNNKIDPNGMVHLMETLKKETEDSSKFNLDVELLQTHPLTDTRINYLKKEIANRKHIQCPISSDCENIWIELKASTQPEEEKK